MTSRYRWRQRPLGSRRDLEPNINGANTLSTPERFLIATETLASIPQVLAFRPILECIFGIMRLLKTSNDNRATLELISSHIRTIVVILADAVSFYPGAAAPNNALLAHVGMFYVALDGVRRTLSNWNRQNVLLSFFRAEERHRQLLKVVETLQKHQSNFTMEISLLNSRQTDQLVLHNQHLSERVDEIAISSIAKVDFPGRSDGLRVIKHHEIEFLSPLPGQPRQFGLREASVNGRVKLIRQYLPSERVKMEKEIETYVCLRHENVLQVCGVSEKVSSVPFIVFHTAIQSRNLSSLAEELRSRGLDNQYLALTARLSFDLGSAVRYLQGLRALSDRQSLHQTLRPDNVLLSATGHIVLAGGCDNWVQDAPWGMTRTLFGTQQLIWNVTTEILGILRDHQDAFEAQARSLADACSLLEEDDIPVTSTGLPSSVEQLLTTSLSLFQHHVKSIQHRATGFVTGFVKVVPGDVLVWTNSPKPRYETITNIASELYNISTTEDIPCVNGDYQKYTIEDCGVETGNKYKKVTFQNVTHVRCAQHRGGFEYFDNLDIGSVRRAFKEKLPRLSSQFGRSMNEMMLVIDVGHDRVHAEYTAPSSRLLETLYLYIPADLELEPYWSLSSSPSETQIQASTSERVESVAGGWCRLSPVRFRYLQIDFEELGLQG